MLIVRTTAMVPAGWNDAIEDGLDAGGGETRLGRVEGRSRSD